MQPVKFPFYRRPSVLGNTRGFALVISLTMMILLTVIAVGMLSLASITLRQSDASAMSLVAQSNARMALMIALGELQRGAGPDQRVTTTADIAGDRGGIELEAGKAPLTDLTVLDRPKGLSPVRAGTRHWTGVWEMDRSLVPNPQRETQGVYLATPAPSLVGWLVSGDPTAAQPIRPDSEVAALSGDGRVSDPEKAVVLVGRGTLGDHSGVTVDDFVSAPLVQIRGAAATNGRFAWWVGDEGVKAAMHIDATRGSDDYASLTAQRRAWETVDGLEGYPLDDASAASPTLAKLATFRQAELLAPQAKPAVQRNFHAATVDSRGVIADPLHGGTRIDLTAVLDGGLAASGDLGGVPNPPATNSNIIPRSVARQMRAPTWDALLAYYERASQGNPGELVVTAGTSDREPSIGPLISDFRILLGCRFVPQGRGGASGYKVNPCGKIAIALANPYPVPLRWDQDLEIEVFSETPPGNAPSRIWNLGANSLFLPHSNNPSEPAVFNNTFFRISPGTLGPGEARAYTQPDHLFRDRSNSRIVVDLAPFVSARPFDFNRCIELDTAGIYTTFPALDVRESWTTTLLSVEMRLARAPRNARPLRKIERFELDNGYFGPNTRRPTIQEAARLSGPIPLMLYSFHISQPGTDYTTLMPTGYEAGQRASAVRTFADFNLQATMFPKQIASYNPTPFFMESNSSIAQLPGNPPGGDTGTAFTRNLVADPLPWGRSSATTAPARTILFDSPSRIASIAQLQHADLTGDDRFASISHQPGNAVGNSYAPIWVKRGLTIQNRPDYEVIGSPSPTEARHVMRNYYDVSHLLNTALWDSYFFSTVGSGDRPEVPALVPIVENSPDLRDPMACATNLMIHGAFNVNSTSKQAWKAFLGSTRLFRHPTAGGVEDGAAFPRTLRQPDPASIPPSGTNVDSFSGYRRLSDAQLDALAEGMVNQVRLRGPFLSLSHFVNRALADCAPESRARDMPTRRMLTRAGALQAAIDESGVNFSTDGRRSGFANLRFDQDRAKLAWKQGAPRADMDGGRNTHNPTNVNPREPDWAVTSTDLNYGSMASIAADRWMLSDTRAANELGYRSTGIPGWLTQADVLQVIGPSISARSDTFRIRAYGEAVDGNGRVRAKAWCEAVVQRMPEFLDPADPATARPAALNTVNAKFGRRFEIVLFRWLSESEV